MIFRDNYIVQQSSCLDKFLLLSKYSLVRVCTIVNTKLFSISGLTFAEELDHIVKQHTLSPYNSLFKTESDKNCNSFYEPDRIA